MSSISNFFGKRWLNSRIKSQNVSNKEKWLGYLVGPCGPLLFNAVMATYLNIYYTDVLGLGTVWGGLFLVIFPIISKILDMICSLVLGWLIEKTKTKQGKSRPWLLLSAPLFAISGILLFIIPTQSEIGLIIWVMFSYNFYYSICETIYNTSHNLMVPLSTRNSNQRGVLGVFNNIATIMMSGMLVALVFPMVIMPMLGTSQTLWLICMSILSGISLPFILVEYYYTKERVTLESNDEVEENKVPIRLQLKALFTDKYILLLLGYFLLFTLTSQLKNLALPYYCNYVLGTYSDGITQMLLSVIGGLPMGIGIFLVWPLAKKIGKNNLTILGFILYGLGSLICWVAPTNMYIVLIGQFIKNIGGLPCAYLFMALFSDALDHLEWKNGFRSDGFAMSLYSAITIVAAGVVTSMFNAGLTGAGYIAPETVTTEPLLTDAMQKIIANLDGTFSIIYNQSETVNTVLVLFFVGIEAIGGLLYAIMLLPVRVEKTLSFKQAIIRARQKAKVESLGLVYVAPEEKNRLEQEELEKEAEEAYRVELKERCDKKNLNYEVELEKHISQVEAKKAKLAEKETLAKQKEAAKELKAKEKLENKINSMTPEQKEKYYQRKELQKQKDEERWEKERKEGEAYYLRTQELLTSYTSKK